MLSVKCLLHFPLLIVHSYGNYASVSVATNQPLIALERKLLGTNIICIIAVTFSH